MGALHAGHCALIEAAKARHQHVVVSIFVNPMQFNQAKDLECYPRTEADDQRLLETLGDLRPLSPARSRLCIPRAIITPSMNCY